MINWGIFLVPAAVLLVIPLAIIPAFRRVNGSIMVSGALAALAFAAFWLAFGSLRGIAGNSPTSGIALYCGVVLTLATWALTINAAAIYASFSLQTCFSPEFACPPVDPVRQALAFAGYLACPVAALVYGAVPGAFPSLRRTRKPPAGLTVSPLRAPGTSDDAATNEI